MIYVLDHSHYSGDGDFGTACIRVMAVKLLQVALPSDRIMAIPNGNYRKVWEKFLPDAIYSNEPGACICP